MVLLPLFVSGCRYDLVDEPSLDYNEHKTAADYQDFILPPSKVTASHGECKAVNLSWEAVENAVQYQVFAAESPFSTFSKVSETKGTETEIIIEEESGITKYYCISAVNYYGTVSSKSIVVMGSTLAVPIITSIEPSEEGNSVTVSWWMDNCTAETYLNSVFFNINVYALSAPNVVFKTLVAEGDVRTLLVDGLTSKTEYYFEVEVVNNASNTKESSGKTTAETAHRVIPDAPQAFTVTQGESTEKITLSWQLPDMVWYREHSGVSGFALHPLYFNIYRKLSTQADSEYALVHAYHVTPVNNYNPEDYTPGDTVTWDDTGVVHDKKYTYYIQSVTDGTAAGKVITADSSKTEAVEGWLVSVPSFSIKSDYTKSEDLTAFTKITFSFNAAFETFGKAYTYFVKREKYDLTNPADPVPNGEYEWKYTALSDLNEGSEVFDDPASSAGYYKYTLYVCPASSTDTSSPYHTIEASGKFLVTADANAVPEVETFNLYDGYSNKFVLEFTYNSSYTYTIHWKNVVDGISQAEESLELPAGIFTSATEGELFTYEHNEGITSGDRRIYSLEASMGLSERFRPNSDSTDKVYETLGTAAPVITEYDYDKLLVEWPAVQKAKDEYTVSAKYDEETAELVIADGEDANCEITKVDADGDAQTTDDIKFTCVITKPAGYDDASKSGKTIKFKVTAQNEAGTDSTNKTIDVCTVGPARTDVTIDSKYADIIDVKWTPVEGADGYIIRRITYKAATQRPDLIADDNLSNPDVYYYDVEQKTLTINSEPADSERVSVNLVQDKLKLTDTYKEAQSDTSPYEVNQSYISWGIPYGYTVIPVKHGGSANDFNIAGRAVSFDGNTYNHVVERFGSTKGYGLNVHAKKSESADTQVLEWDAPYNPVDSLAVYYRNANSQNNVWQQINVTNISVTTGGKQTVSFKPDEKITSDYKMTKAYEYLIAYNPESEELTVPPSFIKDTVLGLSAEEASVSYDYTGVPKEKANKGYLLAMDCNPGTGEGYTEVVDWTAWDYNARSIGPTTAYICIKNYNISSSWIRVAALNKDLHFTSDAGAENTTVQRATNDTTIKIEPTTLMDGTLNNPVTKGPLQVLRDAKHYYAMELIRGDTSVIVDTNRYAYRNISQKELVKCALLTMAYGFYLEAGGLPDYSNVGEKFKYSDSKLITGGKGSASFGKGDYELFVGKYDAKITMDNYAPLQKNPSGNSTSVVNISMSNVIAKIQGTADYWLFKFESENFTVSVRPVNDDNKQLPSSYSADLVMSCTGYDNLKISINNQSIVNTSNKNIRKVYFPLQIHSDDDHYWIVDPTYGFWTN